MELYRQMKLEKRDSSLKYPTACIVYSRVIWGPNEKAEVGRKVKVEEDNGEWTTGWEVVEVYGEPLSKQYVQKLSRAHTKQRKASDI